ncbi:ABC transporter permease [Shigella flexneri]
MQIHEPGLMVMSVIANAYANVASSAEFQRNIEELLVAPVPTHVIIAGYVVVAWRVVCLLVFGDSNFTVFCAVQVHSWVFVALTLVLTAVLLPSGLLNSVFAKTFDDMAWCRPCVSGTHVLGGVCASLTLLPPFWQGLSHLNPIVDMMVSPLRLPRYRSCPLVTTLAYGGLYCGVLFNLLVADPTWTWFA